MSRSRRPQAVNLPIVNEIDPESILTPRVWRPIAAHAPTLGTKLRDLINAGGQKSAIEDPRQFLMTLDKVLLAFECAEWTYAAAAKVLECLLDNPHVRHESVELWIRSHECNAWEAVDDCVALVPPQDIRIIRRLPQQGSQKIVFEASWGLYQKTVILKKLLAASIILSREMQSFPLTNEHPNIIRTYLLSSGAETFLVEDKIRTLNDEWRSRGTEETALLTHNIGSALCYLNDKGLVHGDIKPDNIGLDEKRFVLLDFGICRPSTQFTPATTATGSLRTRAPELLLQESEQSVSSDVWALGATLVSATMGGFPLVDDGEPIPRVSAPEQRTQFETELKRRVSTEYEQRIARILNGFADSRLKNLVATMLARRPEDRNSPKQIVRAIGQELPHAIPESSATGRWAMSPAEEAKCILAMWPDRQHFDDVPNGYHEKLRKRIDELSERLGDDMLLRSQLRGLIASNSP